MEVCQSAEEVKEFDSSLLSKVEQRYRGCTKRARVDRLYQDGHIKMQAERAADQEMTGETRVGHVGHRTESTDDERMMQIRPEAKMNVKLPSSKPEDRTS